MLKPPFKLATSSLAAGSDAAVAAMPDAQACCERAHAVVDVALPSAITRKRLSELNPHFLCSVIGTCLGTPELRKLMSRFIAVEGLGDLAVHHEAVGQAGQIGPVTKALNRALDQRHEAAIRRFKAASDEASLAQMWDASLKQGDVPGAYWALLTHRDATTELQQRVFGDVHMLSHLVGAANRADIRRLVAFEAENAELREALERQQLRTQHVLEERDAAIAELQRVNLREASRPAFEPSAEPVATDVAALTAAVALQTDRRERAEASAATSSADVQRLQEELAVLRQHAHALSRELSAAEVQFRESWGSGMDAPKALAPRLSQRRILYVGGRPSSTPAIRELVQRHGGQFQRHDGGMEDRKGMLEAAVAWAQWVFFPVDCIDHDSAGRLKRLCMKLGIVFVPLRSASVASFAAAIEVMDDTASIGRELRRPAVCLRHG